MIDTMCRAFGGPDDGITFIWHFNISTLHDIALASCRLYNDKRYAKVDEQCLYAIATKRKQGKGDVRTG